MPLKGNERVLNIGCGDGRLSAEIVKNLPEGSILGIDVSEARLILQKLITFPSNPQTLPYADRRENFFLTPNTTLSFLILLFTG
ncbi:class I SAM-dependent methyltransferase [Methanosarcina sp. Z-7115]|uniref:Class I SAM-dependent methyltransferase n=1 Tax=Methanosarcina baikalica TaxID=3073890 RepID=A0ABU2CZX5_9EURY|nr:class I SAM-dependent methyltransferase [Methanosarcina sp. Z-7115]MDR7665252.1 class I SAM-dependent methyltransferase [Methanosarcina sp. Z-7115]